MGNPYSNFIFDYLNNNRHKFDEDGNYDASPDERDYVPPPLVTYPNGGWGRRPKIRRPKYSGFYPEGKGPDDIAQERNQYAIQDFENGIKYDHDKCHDNWLTEQKLCKDGKYTQGCWDRANDRHNKCYDLGHYDGLQIWTYQDQTGQPQGDEDPDKSARKKKDAKSKPGPQPKPEDQSDKSKRTITNDPAMAFFMSNPYLMAYSLAHPEAVGVLRDSSNELRAFFRKLVVLPSDYPKGMAPLTKYSPPPALLPALTAPLGPAAAGLRLPIPAPR